MATRVECAEPPGSGRPRWLFDWGAGWPGQPVMEGIGQTLGKPSPWVQRFTRLVRSGGRVLDVAAGQGRHTKWLLQLGFEVVAVDRDLSTLRSQSLASVRLVEADLEEENLSLFCDEQFDGVVVTNYLHRPLLPWIADRLSPGGVLIYETFGEGQQAHGRPRRPEFLLRPGELLAAFASPLVTVAYENGCLNGEMPRVVQRICVVNPARGGGPCELPEC